MKTLGAFFCRGRLAVGVAWIGLSLASSLAPAAYANFNTLDMAAGRSLSPLAQHPIPVQRNAGTSTDALAIRQGYLFGGTERVIKAAIFESDKRQPLSDLRRRDPDLDFVRF